MYCLVYTVLYPNFGLFCKRQLSFCPLCTFLFFLGCFLFVVSFLSFTLVFFFCFCLLLLLVAFCFCFCLLLCHGFGCACVWLVGIDGWVVCALDGNGAGYTMAATTWGARSRSTEKQRRVCTVVGGHGVESTYLSTTSVSCSISFAAARGTNSHRSVVCVGLVFVEPSSFGHGVHTIHQQPTMDCVSR